MLVTSAYCTNACAPRRGLGRPNEGIATDGTMTQPQDQATDTLKDQGNREFKQGNWLKAAALYTKAIKDEPSNSVLYRYALLACSLQPLFTVCLLLRVLLSYHAACSVIALT